MKPLLSYILEKLVIDANVKSIIIDDELEKICSELKDFLIDNCKCKLDKKYFDLQCVREDWPHGPLNKIQFSSGISSYANELEKIKETIKQFLNDNKLKYIIDNSKWEKTGFTCSIINITILLYRVIVEELKYDINWFYVYKVNKDNFIVNDDNDTHHITVSFKRPLVSDEKKLDEIFKILEKELKSYKIKKGKNAINDHTKFIIYL